MRNMSEKACLVVPCFNEAKRLDLEEFAGFSSKHYFLFVNDGSFDQTLSLLQKNIKENMYILNLEKNVGKGEAVRQGMLHIKTMKIFENITWVGYWDADLATPLKEIDQFILYAKSFYRGTEAIWGSRIDRLGSSIKRSYKRHLFGRLFTTVISYYLGVNSYDSQCGAKLFKKELISELFAEPFISRWIFDVELFLRLKQHKVVEYPVQEWRDVDGGKLKVRSEIMKVLSDIIKIKRKYKLTA